MRPQAKSGIALTLLALMLGVALLTGCQPPPAADQHAEQAAEQGAEDGAEGEEGAEEDHQAGAGIKLAEAGLPFRGLEIKTPDDVTLYGQLSYPGLPPAPVVSDEDEEEASDEEASGPPPEPAKPAVRYPLIILLHQLDGNLGTWDKLPEHLVARGYAVFSLDFRGHGKSTRRGKSRTIHWQKFEADDWQQLPRDVAQVIKFLQQSKEHPEVDATRVGIIGASIGANTAIISGARDPEDIKALVLLSPGLNYKGLDTVKTIINYPNPVFLVASQEDEYAYDSSNKLYHWAMGQKAIRQFKKAGHGIEMLHYQPDLEKQMLDWLQQRIPPAKPPKAAATATAEPAAEKPATH